LSEKELSVELGLPYTTIREMRLGGKCPYFNVGKRIFYRLETVLAWIKKQEKAKEPEQIQHEKIRRID